MDEFIRQLKELTNSTREPRVSDHCKHVAIKLLRRFKNGTRGTLELRYLLEDLLSSLPEPTRHGYLPPLSDEDPYKDLKAFAKLFAGENGVGVPLKAKPKRPASIDASGLVADTKRSKVDGNVSDSAVLQEELANVQLLYDLFNDIKTYTSPPSSSKLSISGLLSQALSTKSSPENSLQGNSGANGTSTSNSSTTKLDIASLERAVNSLLPPPPRGQTLRNKADHLFSYADSAFKPSITINYRRDLIFAQLDFLDGLAEILAHLCAPIRDAQVYTVQNAIATAREYASIGTNKSKLNKAIGDAETEVKKLVLDMQHDLQLFKLGITVATTDEEELRATIRKEAMDREKKVVTQLYGDPLAMTKTWMQNVSRTPTPLHGERIQKIDLARCLVEALFKPQPITVGMQPTDTASTVTNGSVSTQANIAPPIFHLAAKHLFVTQNRLQAFTILATLNTIVPPSTGQLTNASNGPESTSTWSDRVWTLLTSEMADDDENTTSGEGNETHVRLANLADEVVKVLRQAGKGDGDGAIDKDFDEEKIRSSVDRMLRLGDRVFALLHGRLRTALVESLVGSEGSAAIELQVKGFGVLPLPVEMGITSKQLSGILDWACESWSVE